jgi:hypothetical protein
VTSCYYSHWLGSIITNVTRGLDAYFPSKPSDSEVHHKAMGLEEYHSSRERGSGTLLPTSLILNRGKCIVTNKIMGHFVDPANIHNSIFF